MGCDIHPYIEIKQNQNWVIFNDFKPWQEDGYPIRNYRFFGWLCGVRNYSGVTPLIDELRGLPSDISEKNPLKEPGPDLHSYGYVTLAELLAVNYEETILDRRVTRQIATNFSDGGCTTDDPSEAKSYKLSEWLPKTFFETLTKLKELGLSPEDVRIVFAFDN